MEMIAFCIALSLRYVAKLYFCNERIIKYFLCIYPYGTYIYRWSDQ